MSDASWIAGGRRVLCLAVVLGISVGPVLAQTTDEELRAIQMRREIERAFSPVGKWTITKMDVVLFDGVMGQAGKSEATVAKATAVVKSSLGEVAEFTVSENGAITGKGSALYQVRVSGGTAASNFAAPSVPIPIGATAEGGGTREFTITGAANLKTHVVSLKAFQIQGGALDVKVTGGGKVSFAAWPPMTNVESKVVVSGASLILRAAGSVGKFHVQFEAVKHVDLQPLFEMLLQSKGRPGAAGSDGRPGFNGADGSDGSDGSDAEPSDTPELDKSTDAGEETADDEARNEEKQWRAGTVVVTAGGSAAVRFGKALSGSYTVSLTPQQQRAGDFSIGYSAKSASGFTVHVRGGKRPAGGRVTIDWLAVPHQ